MTCMHHVPCMHHMRHLPCHRKGTSNCMHRACLSLDLDQVSQAIALPLICLSMITYASQTYDNYCLLLLLLMISYASQPRRNVTYASALFL